MRIAIGTDHAGWPLKVEAVKWLADWGFEVDDVGAHGYDADDDYPDYSFAVAEAVASGRADRGVICCGSGVGATIAANKVPGARAAACHDSYSAHQGVEHDDMNVLCLGARVIGLEAAREALRAFVGARFSGEERHERRLAKVKAAEAAYLGAAPHGAE
ncbi:MAG: ribose 5-phosphate isomerase B [Chloroflexota bacterium]|nr:ribose 5-phosphate isomerase B [Chloroflexota bacterium]